MPLTLLKRVTIFNLLTFVFRVNVQKNSILTKVPRFSRFIALTLRYKLATKNVCEWALWRDHDMSSGKKWVAVFRIFLPVTTTPHRACTRGVCLYTWRITESLYRRHYQWILWYRHRAKAVYIGENQSNVSKHSGGRHVCWGNCRTFVNIHRTFVLKWIMGIDILWWTM